MLPRVQDRLGKHVGDDWANPHRSLDNQRTINPLENKISRPELGRIVPGLLDPNVRVVGILDEYGRQLLKPSDQPTEMPSIPGVKGSGGLKERMAIAQKKHQGLGQGVGGQHMMDKLQQLMGVHASQQTTQVPLKQQGNLRNWRM